MKLNKVNKNGSLSIILPKDIISKLDLKEGNNVDISAVTKNSIIFSLKKIEKHSLEELLKELELTKDSFYKLIETLPKELNNSEDILKDLLKYRLLGILESI